MPKKKIDKPYNNGTMSSSAFWGMIRAALRQRTRWWKPIAEVKAKAKRKNQSANKRLKYEYQCALCKNWFPDKQVQVDHIVEAGSLNSAEDLKLFVERLFCEKEGLQVLCTTCHNKKTKEYKDAKKPI